MLNPLADLGDGGWNFGNPTCAHLATCPSGGQALLQGVNPPHFLSLFALKMAHSRPLTHFLVFPKVKSGQPPNPNFGPQWGGNGVIADALLCAMQFP